MLIEGMDMESIFTQMVKYLMANGRQVIKMEVSVMTIVEFHIASDEIQYSFTP